jgi:pSer/pThr/pTyr-binding forkhead associated (FHA) protein
MGCLQHLESGDQCWLSPEHLVGRSPRAALCLKSSYVSVQHASIRWTGKNWEIKDLGSRNGTRIDGALVEPGKVCGLELGMKVSFGRSEQTWEMVDDGPPRAIVAAVDDPDERIIIQHDIVPLPSAEEPAVTIFRRPDGSWKVEQNDSIATLIDGHVLDVQGRKWRFTCPKGVSNTETTDWPHFPQRDLQLIRLSFRVSSDEEHVQLRVCTRNEEIDLGSRAHNYLLLHLARQRIMEEQQGMADTASGWLDRESLLAALRTDRERLNLDVFRIRKQFALIGVRNAADVIERRPGTSQLRIGVGRLSIERI